MVPFTILCAAVALVALVALFRERRRALRFEDGASWLAAHHGAMFEAMPDGLAVTDDAGTIVRLNAVGRELVGVATEDERASRLSLADDTNPLVQALREGNTSSGLEVAIGGNGQNQIIQVKLAKLSDDEASRAAVAVFRDVTRERVLEHDLRRKGAELEANIAALTRATQQKSEFLANMSHELRTPLNAVLGFTEVLMDGCYGTLNERQLSCASDVLGAGRHLLGLINDILDLSKIEAGRMELAVENLDVSELTSQALTFVRPQAAANAIELRLSEPSEPLCIRGDADRVRQILINLLSNAVKFTPHGSVHLSATATGDIVTISVTDTGIGIAPADAEKLFKDFSQVDGSVTRRFGGTGLGLAICKRLAAMHGGTIGFESETGKGSRFWLNLPRAERQVRPTFGITRPLRSTSARPTARTDHEPPTVLIVDADDAAARLAAHMLEGAGIPAVIACTLADARKLAATQPVEAIVIDPTLPETTVTDALAFARKRFGVSMVVTSTLGSEDLGVPSRAYAAKPFDRATMVEHVQAARRRALRRRALVIDSSEDAATVGALLESDGFEVDIAPNLHGARAALANRYGLVVLEISQPDGDGASLLDELQKRKGCSTIVLTARELTNAEMRDLQGHGVLVLSKGTLSRSSFLRHVNSLSGEQRRRRVLAVDDNDQNLRLISTMLAHRGYDVLEARDALSAVAIARNERPDVILMDVMLPDMDGLAATRELKRDVLTHGIPVIAVTAQAMAGDAERALSAGCTDYLAKPIDSVRLIGAVERALA